MEQKKEIIVDPNQLHLGGNFYDQVKEILQTITMSENDRKEIEIMTDDLEKKLSKIIKGCQLKVFGSIAMRLAFKNSDLDLFCDCTEENLENCVERIHDYLSKNPNEYQHIYQYCIKKKQITVTSFTHSKLKRQCDITCQGPRAVHVSELVKHLLQVDDRAMQLMIVIKYWTKINNFEELNLPTIGLIFLVIFFLQNKRILPPVATLQAKVSPEIVDDWNVAFHKQIKAAVNNESLFRLMGGFFEYFEHFDFANLAISPYVGYPVERRKFLDVNEVPSEFKLYKERVYVHNLMTAGVPMCVQDPFDHTRNIAIAVKKPAALKIIELFKYAAACHRFSRRKPEVFLGYILAKQQRQLPLLQQSQGQRRRRRQERNYRRALAFAERWS